MNIAAETRTLIQAALHGDPAIASLVVTGSSPDTLRVQVEPGTPPNAVGGTTYSPEPPFRRETLGELVVRMQRRRWQRLVPVTRMLDPPQDKDLLALRTTHARAKVPFECCSGWTDLLAAVITWLEETAPQAEWRPAQIKQKFGTLRFYWDGDLPELGQEVIEAAEQPPDISARFAARRGLSWFGTAGGRHAAASTRRTGTPDRADMDRPSVPGRLTHSDFFDKDAFAPSGNPGDRRKVPSESANGSLGTALLDKFAVLLFPSRQRILIMNHPIGAVGAITPWTVPNAWVTRKVGPALAAGCAIVPKPAAQTPFLALAEFARRARLPEGLFSVVTGDLR